MTGIELPRKVRIHSSQVGGGEGAKLISTYLKAGVENSSELQLYCPDDDGESLVCFRESEALGGTNIS